MNWIIRAPKMLAKSLLELFGLDARARRLWQLADPQRRRFRRIETFEASVKGVDLVFSTKDEYSNAWFYPRYAGGRIHEPAVSELFLSALADTSCFADVGTNLGWYTCLAARSMPSGRVFGFEMDELNCALLRKNVELNGCDNVETIHTAISDSCAKVTYCRDGRRPNPTLSLSTADDSGSSAERVSVDATTLDRFFTDRSPPDVVKIDVEGAEMNVLRGMSGLLREKRPIVFLEIHPAALPRFDTSAASVVSVLIGAGYRVSEIEDMRSDDSPSRLVGITTESALERNAMLYAEPFE